jgi:hypothetical protein
MGKPVKLSDTLIESAATIAAREHRSIPNQIEYYFKLAAIADDNPDLSFNLIKDILHAQSAGPVGDYKFN